MLFQSAARGKAPHAGLQTFDHRLAECPCRSDQSFLFTMAPPAQLADAIAELLQSSVLSQPLAPITPTPTIDAKTIGQLIDHTLLAPGSTPKEIEDASKIAVQYNAKTLCVNSSMIPTAVKALGSGGPKAISVVGFPFGAANTPGKVEETKFAVQQGAEEIDMVRN